MYYMRTAAHAHQVFAKPRRPARDAWRRGALSHTPPCCITEEDSYAALGLDSPPRASSCYPGLPRLGVAHTDTEIVM